MTPSLSNNKGLAERNSGVPMNPPLFRKKKLYNIHILYNNQMLITRQSRIPQRNLVITPLPHVAILSISVKMDVAHDEGIVCDLNLIDRVGYVTFICFGDVRLACLSLPLPLHTLVCLSITNLGLISFKFCRNLSVGS